MAAGELVAAAEAAFASRGKAAALQVCSASIQAVFRLYSGCIQALFRLYSGSILRLYSQALFRLYSGSMQRPPSPHSARRLPYRYEALSY